MKDLALSEIHVNMRHDPQISRIDSALAYDRGALTPRGPEVIGAVTGLGGVGRYDVGVQPLAKYLGVAIVVFTGVASEDAPRIHNERASIDIDSVERIAIIVIIVRVVAFAPITGLGRVRVAGPIPFP